LDRMYYLYIITSEKDGTYYIGQTKNLEDRIYRHNSGHSKATKSKRPWKLVYCKEFETRSEAVRYEKELKQKKSRKYIEQLIGA